MKYIALFISSLLILSACSEDIDLTLSTTHPFFVVDGHICDEVSPYNFVRLTMSSDYFQNTESPAVRGASVVINDGEQDIVFEEQEPGYYMAPAFFAGMHGKTYHLIISNVDIDGDGVNESYTAESVMPPTYGIDSVKCTYDNFLEIYKIGMYAHEDTSTENFYMFGYSYNDSLVCDSYLDYAITDDSYFSSDYCWGATISTLREDFLKSGVINVGDTITVHALSINEDLFKYIAAVDDIDSGSNPMFSSTPANAVGNISNGALGFFTAMAVVHVQCFVEK
ncbi:MAG: DUF4249 domain-containing protein [Bacteroidales bacterium]|nr:DUF4249 domain-containing protein [Bacteroidales bacterium]